MEEAIFKARVLTEALPYIRSFHGRIVVVKLGGSFMDSPDALGPVLTDVVFMRTVGIHPVVVHGGGKAITRAMDDAGIEPRFVAGQRYTDTETLRIVEDVLVGEVNRQIVTLLNEGGVKAEPLHTKGRCALRAEKMAATDESGKSADLGFVGSVTGVDALLIRGLTDLGIVPVIAPLAVGSDGQKYNVNADVAAAEVAIALKAEKLVNVSDTHGIRAAADDEQSLVPTLHEAEIEEMLADGVISGGMIPKVTCCLKAIDGGVKKAHIIDGRIPHSLLLEIYTDKGIGTEILK